MSIDTREEWLEANRRYLLAGVARVHDAIVVFAEGKPPQGPQAFPTYEGSLRNALEIIVSGFGLTPFERDVLLLCAGIELNDEFATLVARIVGDAGKGQPSFALALAALPEAHWSATTPTAPLRRFRLVEMLSNDGPTRSPLRIDERILHYLMGVSYLDERLAGLVSLVEPPDLLPESHCKIASRLEHVWTEVQGAVYPFQLCGSDADAAWAIASRAAAHANMALHVVRMKDLSSNAGERENFVRLWQRESILGAGALLLAHDDPESAKMALSLAQRIAAPCVLVGVEPHGVAAHAVRRIDVPSISKEEQRQVWLDRLGPGAAALNGQLDVVISNFHLTADDIRASAERVMSEGDGDRAPVEIMWEACRTQSRAALDDLARRIEPMAGWDDLVIGDAQRDILREIVAHVRQRAKVYGSWGFAAKSNRGLGVSALFAGGSGTGKTMAAEVLARELALDLHAIDLSQVVNKYIGETEKNLRRVFDAAERGGTILLFDEADALFGKRSEVKDSHDRHANIEVSYLLSRMEAYRGLSILTTNQKNALDTAFMRRIRFCIDFQFPDENERREIWKRAFPAGTPTEGLDPDKLARLNVAGGNIRNIAMSAAFLAADAGESVQMKHLVAAAGRECAKIERPLSEFEIGGWV